MPQTPTKEQERYLHQMALMQGQAVTPLAVYLKIHGAGSATRAQRAEILRTVRRVFNSLKAQGWVTEVTVKHKGQDITYYRLTGRGLKAIGTAQK